MEKMIGVINENLKSVLSGISSHREETKKALEEINDEIDGKVTDAGTFRIKVNDARSTIQSLENDISSLEEDLKELKEKFASRNFTEILSAADKEINGKIKEKKKEISKQAEIIKDITDKANSLKQDLIDLKKQKAQIEEKLKDAEVLSSFYEQRINDIIAFSEKHTKDLGDFVSTSDKTPYTLNETEIEQALKNVDGSIFEEIAAISKSDPTEEEAKNALDTIVVEEEDPEEEKTKALSTTQQLDDIILAAKKILEKESTDPNTSTDNKPKKEEPKKEEVKKPVPVKTVVVPTTKTIPIAPVLVATAVPQNNVKHDESQIKKEIKLPKEPLVLDTSYSELKENYEPAPTKPFNEALLANHQIDNAIVNDDLEELETLDTDNKNVVEVTVPEEPSNNYSKFNDVLDKALADAEKQLKEDEEEIPFADIFKGEAVLEERKPIPVNQPDEQLNSTNGTDVTLEDKDLTFDELKASLDKLGLDVGHFTDDAVDKLLKSYNESNTEKFINILEKHGLDKKVIYDNVDVLLEVTIPNLDKILDLLEQTAATNIAIDYVYKYFNKININKLEMAIVPNENKELSHVLFDAIDYFSDGDLVSRLGLSKQEEYVLKDKTTQEEFKRMCMFQDIVYANYVTLRDLKINNLKECITKHPKRFLMNPDRFTAILDKYDTEDLIRCINKNSAVLDKL